MTRTVRVTCTIPADALGAADRLAARWDRSRSWVVTEALRRLVADRSATGPAAVHEPSSPLYEARRAFRAAAQARLHRDLALTPEERVRISEEIAGVAPTGRRSPRAPRVLQFDTYEDYLDWKRFAGLEP